jgi:adenine C2-methylase RlmN of 23S rRNA A2503 and tRNA A37
MATNIKRFFGLSVQDLVITVCLTTLVGCLVIMAFCNTMRAILIQS